MNKNIVPVISKIDFKKNVVLQKMTSETDLIIHIQKGIYNDHIIFMVSWWGIYSYFKK